MSQITDKLGNHFKPGQMVQVTLRERTVLAQVQDVKPGGLIGVGPDAMPMPGSLILVAVFPLQVEQGIPVDGVYVLQQPKMKPDLPQ